MDTLYVKKIVEPIAGHGWTIVFAEPQTEASIKSFGLKLPKEAIVIDGTVEFGGLDNGGDDITRFILHMAQAAANNKKLSHLYYKQ